ncbi:unnamed protein product, partial [Rotaria magnacalcarata]
PAEQLMKSDGHTLLSFPQLLISITTLTQIPDDACT